MRKVPPLSIDYQSTCPQNKFSNYEFSAEDGQLKLLTPTTT